MHTALLQIVCDAQAGDAAAHHAEVGLSVLRQLRVPRLQLLQVENINKMVRMVRFDEPSLHMGCLWIHMHICCHMCTEITQLLCVVARISSRQQTNAGNVRIKAPHAGPRGSWPARTGGAHRWVHPAAVSPSQLMPSCGSATNTPGHHSWF